MPIPDTHQIKASLFEQEIPETLASIVSNEDFVLDSGPLKYGGEY